MVDTLDLDIFFDAPVTQEMFENLESSLGFPVSAEGWKTINYQDGGCGYCVTVRTPSERLTQLVGALWQYLHIPFIAYESIEKNYHHCAKWVANTDGVKKRPIFVELDSSED